MECHRNYCVSISINFLNILSCNSARVQIVFGVKGNPVNSVKVGSGHEDPDFISGISDSWDTGIKNSSRYCHRQKEKQKEERPPENQTKTQLHSLNPFFHLMPPYV